MGHHADHGRHRPVPDRESLGVGPGHRQPVGGVAQHSCREVDADRCPPQPAEPVGVHPGTATDLQTHAAVGVEQLAQRAVDAQPIAVTHAGPSPAAEERVLVPVRDLAMTARVAMG